MEDLNRIEDFVDRIAVKGKKKNFFLDSSKDASIPKDLIKLKQLKNKFVKLMSGPPYDIPSDEV